MHYVDALVFALPALNSAASDRFDLCNLSLLNVKSEIFFHVGICEVSCILMMCVLSKCVDYNFFVHINLKLSYFEQKRTSFWSCFSSSPVVGFYLFYLDYM